MRKQHESIKPRIERLAQKFNDGERFTREEIVQVLVNNGFNVNVTNLTNIFNVMQCRHPVNITYDQKHLFYITRFSGKN